VTAYEMRDRANQIEDAAIAQMGSVISG